MQVCSEIHHDPHLRKVNDSRYQLGDEPSLERTTAEMRKFRDPVVVLGGGLTGLGIARTLGSHGINIYLVVDQKDEAIYSNCFKKTFIVPEFRYNRELLKDLLKGCSKSLSRRTVVYPTSDLDALNLSELKDELSDDYHFVVGDKKPVEILVNKSMFYRMLDSEGISHPVTYFAEDIEDVKRIAKKIAYPAFIRPSITQIFNRVFGARRKGFIVYSPRELMEYYRLATRYGVDVMFQEIIPGPPSNSYQLEGYYNNNNLPTVLFARQRLRIWPLDFGNTTLCISIPISRLREKKRMINKFLKQIGYQGLMSAEFKKDARDGILKFLEINARAWWHFWLSARCGADIILYSYLDAIGEKTEYVEKYETGVKSLYLLNDLGASAKMILNGDLTINHWFSSFSGPADYALFRRSDLSPFIMSFALRAYSLLTGRLKSKRNASKLGS